MIVPIEVRNPSYGYHKDSEVAKKQLQYLWPYHLSILTKIERCFHRSLRSKAKSSKESNRRNRKVE